MPENKETWWVVEIQRVVARKKNKFNLWQKGRKREDWIKYENLCNVLTQLSFTYSKNN